MDKIVNSIKEVIALCGLKDGMTVSFHHHMRNGDFVLNTVMHAIADLGIKDITINASSIFDVHYPIVDQIANGVITGIETSYIGAKVGEAISHGILKKPVTFFSHGGRVALASTGKSHIDVAFIAAPTSDPMGNCSGKYGPSACGALGYAFTDAMYADKVVVITDNLVSYPLMDHSITEDFVDYVVKIDRIGDREGIVSGTTKITRDPVSLLIANYAAKAVASSGLLVDGFSFQTGAGGTSLAAARYLKDIMVRNQIHGSFAMGGITGYMVEMLHAGCFQTLFDVQCFDLEAAQSIKDDPNHIEVTAAHYASPASKSAIVDNLDAVVLGATEVDTNFNVNVHTNSYGYIMGGSGGHSDASAGAKLTIIVAPLIRARLGLISDRVTAISTPGNTVDLIVTQYGLAVNPARTDLRDQLNDAKLPIMDIHALKELSESITGKPKPLLHSDHIVADIKYRDESVIDHIYQVSD